MPDKNEKEAYRVDIPLEIDADSIIKFLRFRGTNERLESVARELIDKATSVARPKAIYMVSQAHRVERDTVEVDDVRFSSRVLNKLIDTPKTVYPLITTIGPELDELTALPRDMWRNLCLDTIKTIVLISGIEYLSGYLKDKYSLESTAYMNPGEIDDFPISQQVPLFSLFDGAEKQIGVSLTKGGAMKPIKSRSGIMFPDDTGFLSCRLCTQPRCPGRRAAYDPELEKEMLS
jgi:hypothetical protein